MWVIVLVVLTHRVHGGQIARAIPRAHASGAVRPSGTAGREVRVGEQGEAVDGTRTEAWPIIVIDRGLRGRSGGARYAGWDSADTAPMVSGARRQQAARLRSVSPRD